MGLSYLSYLMWLAHNSSRLRYRRSDDIEDVEYEDITDEDYENDKGIFR